MEKESPLYNEFARVAAMFNPHFRQALRESELQKEWDAKTPENNNE